MDLSLLDELIRLIGPVAAVLLIVLVYTLRREAIRDKRYHDAQDSMAKRIDHREARMSARIAELENGQRDALFEMVKRSTAALADNSAALREFADVVGRMPCINHQDQGHDR